MCRESRTTRGCNLNSNLGPLPRLPHLGACNLKSHLDHLGQNGELVGQVGQVGQDDKDCSMTPPPKDDQGDQMAEQDDQADAIAS